MLTSSVHINGVDISFVDVGEFENENLIFIHAFPMSLEMWQPQIDFFSQHYRTIAFDLRGFGSSSRTQQHLSIDLFVGDLLALIEKLELKNVTLIGLSMGGYIAQRFYQFYPELVKKLILCNTRSQADTPESKAKRIKLIEYIKNGNFEIFVDNFIKSSLSENNIKLKYDFLNNIILKNNTENICDALVCLANRPDTTSILSIIKVPTLFIAGQNDSLIPVEVIRGMSEKVQNSKLVVFKNVGHFSNIENSELFNKTILNFINLEN